MKKNISIVSKGLVIDVGRLEKSHIKGWVGIYSRAGERIGGFDLIDNTLRLIHKNEKDNNISLVYALISRREVK